MAGCGHKKKENSTIKKMEITITGLDGNGVAEKSITTGLQSIDGVTSVAFNYLNNQVVVAFDTVKITQDSILHTIQGLDDGRYKVLDVKENKEPIKKSDPAFPHPQDDIHDDISDEYKDNV